MKPILATLVAVALGLSVTSINANNTKERRPVLQTSDRTTVLQKQQKERVDRSQPVKECDGGECSYNGSKCGPCTW